MNLSSSFCYDSISVPDLGKPLARVSLAPVPSIWDNRDEATAANQKQSLNITQLDPSDSIFKNFIKNSNTLPFTVNIVDLVETVDGFANVHLLRD
jgi:hypothetical protein